MYRAKPSRTLSALAAVAALALSSSGAGCGVEGSEEAALDSLHEESTSTDTAKLQGKLFGYVFGDGNYHPHKTPPRNAEFQAPLQILARDFVLSACKAGYSGRILSKHEEPSRQRINCATFTSSSTLTKGTSKYLLVIEGFSWPAGGDFKQLAETASSSSLKGFVSGLLPVEGTQSGLIDDQFPDKDYTADAQIDLKLRSVERILERLGFRTAQLRRDGDACTSRCRTVNIDARREGCRFNPAEGYTFASYARVPGATGEGLSSEPPPRCP
ncbi:MAG: hypothetical protein U1A78_31900 [Polyangia bacterium]